MPIAFVRDFEFTYGEPQQVSPVIRRVVSRNPGPFTFHGTGVYIVGREEVAVIDPGPDIEGQQDMLARALGAERVTHILVTHRHLDHSPAARALAARTGAKIYASGIAPRFSPDDFVAEAGDDLGFKPDVVVQDGDVFTGPGWTLEALFAPGHTSDHLCFALREENALFSGDHVMGWSTTVISPPDGDMDAYLASLARVRDEGFATIWPTHGPPIGAETGRSPATFVQSLIDHRLEREAQIMAQLRAGRTRIPDMVPAMYADVDPRLHLAAAHSVLAHMIRLTTLGKVKCNGKPELGSAFALA